MTEPKPNRTLGEIVGDFLSPSTVIMIGGIIGLASNDVFTDNLSNTVELFFPSWADRKGISAFLIVASLLAVIGGALWEFVLKRTHYFRNIAILSQIEEIDDVEEFFGLSVLGIVPECDGPIDAKCLERASIPYHMYHRLTQSIEDWSAPEHNVLLVTSANVHEGKSTTAAMIARVASEMGKRVLLIDFDLYRSSQSYIWSIDRERNLENLLNGGEYQLQESAKNLWVLTCANAPFVSAPLIRSVKNSIEYKELVESFDFTVVDSPPVVSLFDAIGLARYVGKVLFVVRWTGVKVRVVKWALKLLKKGRGSPDDIGLALVLKQGQLSTFSDDGFWGGYDNYGYGYGYDFEKASTTEDEKK